MEMQCLCHLSQMDCLFIILNLKLAKAVKWLGKKIQEARNDPSVSFGDFTEYFITLEVS